MEFIIHRYVHVCLICSVNASKYMHVSMRRLDEESQGGSEQINRGGVKKRLGVNVNRVQSIRDLVIGGGVVRIRGYLKMAGALNIVFFSWRSIYAKEGFFEDSIRGEIVRRHVC